MKNFAVGAVMSGLVFTGSVIVGATSEADPFLG